MLEARGNFKRGPRIGLYVGMQFYVGTGICLNSLQCIAYEGGM